MNKYYIYAHINKATNQIFYIGRGHSTRSNSKSYRSEWWHRIVNKYGYDIDIIEKNLSNDDANTREKHWIKMIGRVDLNTGPLVNLTNGGDGCVGHIHTEATKRKMSAIHSNCSDEYRAKMSISVKRAWTKRPRKLSPEHIAKLKTCHNFTPEVRRNMALSQIGKRKSIEARKKLSESIKLNWIKRKQLKQIQNERQSSTL